MPREAHGQDALDAPLGHLSPQVDREAAELADGHPQVRDDHRIPNDIADSCGYVVYGLDQLRALGEQLGHACAGLAEH